MTENDWQGRLTQQVTAAVRDYRKLRGMSAQGLADACAALGHAIPRTSIANLENGRRSGVEIAELLVFAKALDVPPIALLLPIGMAGSVEVLPGQELPIWDAVSWVTAETLIGEDRNRHRQRGHLRAPCACAGHQLAAQSHRVRRGDPPGHQLDPRPAAARPQ